MMLAAKQPSAGCGKARTHFGCIGAASLATRSAPKNRAFLCYVCKVAFSLCAYIHTSVPVSLWRRKSDTSAYTKYLCTYVCAGKLTHSVRQFETTHYYCICESPDGTHVTSLGPVFFDSSRHSLLYLRKSRWYTRHVAGACFFYFRRYTTIENHEARRSASGGSRSRSPLRPVALRPRPSPPGSFQATAPYDSIFAPRRRGGEDAAGAEAAAHEGGALPPPRDSHAAPGPKPGGGGAWTPPPLPTSAAGVPTAAAADAGSSLLVEPGSVGAMLPSPPPPVSRADGRRGESRLRAEAKPAASVPTQRPHPPGTAGQGRVEMVGLGRGADGGGEEGRWSVGSSSTSTLPPLDQELSELLER